MRLQTSIRRGLSASKRASSSSSVRSCDESGGSICTAAQFRERGCRPRDRQASEHVLGAEAERTPELLRSRFQGAKQCDTEWGRVSVNSTSAAATARPKLSSNVCVNVRSRSSNHSSLTSPRSRFLRSDRHVPIAIDDLRMMIHADDPWHVVARRRVRPRSSSARRPATDRCERLERKRERTASTCPRQQIVEPIVEDPEVAMSGNWAANRRTTGARDRPS